MSAEDSSSYLISTLKGFGKAADEAEDIVDVYNEVANNWAIDTAGIGEALQRSAASFYAANTDLEKSVALITATNTVVQDPSSVGTLWKTLSARIRGAKTELEELDEETDEYTETTSKLRDLVMGLTGFDILEEDGKTFKDIYEIILGIGKEWENLTDIEQASLAEVLAGKRNSNALLAVLNNLDTLQGAYKSALEAEGSAQKEQENYARSIQYSIDVLKASAQEFWTTLINSGAAKWVIDFLTKLLNVLTEITEKTNGIPVLAGSVFLAAFGKNPQGTVNTISQVFEKLVGRLDLIPAATAEAAGGMTGLAGAMVKVKTAVATLLANPIAPWLLAAVAAVGAFAFAWDAMTTTVAEAQDDLDKTASKISDLQEEIKELKDLDYRNEEQETRLSYLEKELDYQEKIYDIERKRILQEKVGRKFSDWFDKDNYNRRYNKEQDYYTKDSYSQLITDFYINQNKAADLEQQKKGYINWLNHNKDELSTEEIEAYTQQIGDLQRQIDDLNSEDIIFAKDLNSKATEFKGIIDELQEAIDDGILIGSDRENAEKIISEYSEMYQKIMTAIAPILREQGLFDYSSIISSALDKADFKGVEDKLVELAKEGSLSEQVLEESFSGLVAELALAGVKTEELKDYILELAGLPNVSRMAQNIAPHLKQTYYDEQTGVALNQAKILEDKLKETFSDEELKLIPKLDIEYDGDTVEGAIAEIQKAINDSSETPVKVEATIIDSVEGVNKRLKSQFDELGQMYQGIFYGDNGFSLVDIDNEQLESLRKAFIDLEDERGNKVGATFKGGEEAVNKFIDTITSAETKSMKLADQQKVVQSAFNELATSYFYSANGLKELNDETKDALSQQFKKMGILNADEIIEAGLQIHKLQDEINNLNFDKLIYAADEAARAEEDKIHDWGLDDYYEDIVNETIQAKYGNVDMDKRTIIRYNDEILETFKEAMSSWPGEIDEATGEVLSSYYESISEAVRNGDSPIDTVFGGQELFKLDTQEIEVAFSPIMVDQNGQNPQFLSKDTVVNYIQKVLDQADAEISKSGEQWSEEAVIKRAMEIDLKGLSTEEIDSQGRVVGKKFVHGIIAGIGEESIDVDRLMHFSGEEGAWQIANDAIEVYSELKKKASEGTLELTDLTAKEISILQNEGVITQQSAKSIAQLALQKQISNGIEITTTQSVQALADLARQAGIDIAELTVLNRVMQLLAQKDAAVANGAGDAAAAIQAEVDRIKNNMVAEIQNSLANIQVGLDFAPATASAGKGGGEAGDAYVEAYSKELEKLEDLRDQGKLIALVA